MLPQVSTVPLVGFKMPETIFKSVLLPEPLSPTMPRESPFSSVNDMSRNAQNS